MKHGMTSAMRWKWPQMLGFEGCALVYSEFDFRPGSVTRGKFQKGRPHLGPIKQFGNNKTTKGIFISLEFGYSYVTSAFSFGISIKHLSVSPLHHIMCQLRIPTSNQLMRWPYVVALSQSSNHK
jgi:hypothetical protein